MKDPLKYLLGVFIYIGFGLFIYGVVLACIHSWNDGTVMYKYPPVLSSIITSIAALMATNLGAVLGITIANPSSNFHQSKTWNPLTLFSDPSPNQYQTTAIYVYVVLLIVCGIVWVKRDFEETPDQIIAIVPSMSKTLMGVIIGSIALGLNIKTNSERIDNPKT